MAVIKTAKIVMSRGVIINDDDGTQHHLVAGLNEVPVELAEHYLIQEYALDIPEVSVQTGQSEQINVLESQVQQLTNDLEAVNVVILDKDKQIADLGALVEAKDKALQVLNGEYDKLGKEIEALKGQLSKPAPEKPKADTPKEKQE